MYQVAEHNKIKQEVVDNFLATVDRALSWNDHIHNLQVDAYHYKWNAATRHAIVDGLRKIYK